MADTGLLALCPPRPSALLPVLAMSGDGWASTFARSMRAAMDERGRCDHDQRVRCIEKKRLGFRE